MATSSQKEKEGFWIEKWSRLGNSLAEVPQGCYSDTVPESQVRYVERNKSHSESDHPFVGFSPFLSSSPQFGASLLGVYGPIRRENAKPGL